MIALIGHCRRRDEMEGEGWDWTGLELEGVNTADPRLHQVWLRELLYFSMPWKGCKYISSFWTLTKIALVDLEL